MPDGEKGYALSIAIVAILTLLTLACAAVTSIIQLDETGSSNPISKSNERLDSIEEIEVQESLLGKKGFWSYVSSRAGGHTISVNLFNGNMLLEHTDLHIPSPGLDHTIARTYNSMSARAGDFGYGWSSNIGRSLRLKIHEDDRISLLSSSGAVWMFTQQGGEYISPAGYHYVLKYGTAGQYDLSSTIEGVTYTFDKNGLLVSISDRNGNQQSYGYDSQRCPFEIVDTTGQSTTISCSDTGMIAEIKDRTDRVNRYTYSSRGLLTQYRDPAGNTTSYVYNTDQRMKTLRDPLGDSWAFRYDLQGRIVEITDPLGNTTRFRYENDTTVMTDARGNETVYQFDEYGRLVNRTDARGNSASFSWDSFRNLISITTTLGYTRRLQWEGNTGLLLSTTDAMGNSITYTYDQKNNLIAIKNANGNVTEFRYDEKSANVSEVIQPDGSLVTFEYDEQGNMLDLVDASGNARDPSNPEGIPYRFSYDPNGFVSQIIDPLGDQWDFTWDDRGNLLTRLDANTQSTTYTYDSLDRLVTVTYPDGEQVRFEYDALGNMISMADGFGTSTFEYDAAGRLVREDDPRAEETVGYQYDAIGNLIAIERNDIRFGYGYDELNRLVRQTFSGNEDYAIQYDYDSDSRLTEIIYPDGVTTSYTYYSNGWIESLQSVDAKGAVLNDYAIRNYDRRGNPLEVERTFATYSEDGELGLAHDEWEIQYDNMERLRKLEINEDGGSRNAEITLSYTVNGLWDTRTYDDPDRSQSWQYSYDAASHWTGIEYWDGRETVVTNDANGNQVQIIEESPVTGREYKTIFEYDTTDRISAIIDPTGSKVNLSYNGFGCLTEVGRSLNLDTTRLRYDRLGLAGLKERDGQSFFQRDPAGKIRTVHSEKQKVSVSYEYIGDLYNRINLIIMIQEGGEDGPATSGEGDGDGGGGPIASIDYCFMGNIQGESQGPGGVVSPPLFSNDYFTTKHKNTWQSSDVYHNGNGKIWPNNSQFNNNNIPSIPVLLLKVRFEPDDRNEGRNDFAARFQEPGTQVNQLHNALNNIQELAMLDDDLIKPFLFILSESGFEPQDITTQYPSCSDRFVSPNQAFQESSQVNESGAP